MRVMAVRGATNTKTRVAPGQKTKDLSRIEPMDAGRWGADVEYLPQLVQAIEMKIVHHISVLIVMINALDILGSAAGRFFSLGLKEKRIL